MTAALYTSHLADDDRPNLTACGEPWQGWQAPIAYDGPALAPHTEPRPHVDTIRQCQACLRRTIEEAAA